MNSHNCDHQTVTLLACSALSATEAELTRQQLQRCPACREYFRQMSEVCSVQRTAAQQLPDAKVSPQLGRRIQASLQPRGRRGSVEFAAALSGQWMRIAGLAALLILLVVFFDFHRRPSPSAPVAQPSAPPLPEVAASTDELPRLISYRLALNRSPEEFEHLLTREAAHPGFSRLPPIRAGWARLE